MADNDGKSLVDANDFIETEEEVVRTYGSTTESTPLKSKKSVISDESIVVKIDDIEKSTRSVEKFKFPEDATSRDSDSLMQDVCYSTVRADSGKCWWKHPKVKENWKIILSAFILLIIGLGLLIAGVVVEVVPHTGLQGFVFWIAGLICFIPGAYHVVYVYCAVKGRRGYDFYHLPLFN